MNFSLIAQTFETLRFPPPPRLVLLEARTLSAAHVPPYPPDMPVLLIDVHSRELALHLKNILLTTYPREHVVYIVTEGKKKEKSLGELNADDLSGDTSLYISSLEEGTSFECFAEIVD